MDADKILYQLDHYLDLIDTDNLVTVCVGDRSAYRFRGVWPLELEGLPVCASEIVKDEAHILPALGAPLDIAVMGANNTIQAVRQIPLSKIRGRVKTVCRYMYEHRIAVFGTKKKQGVAGILYYGSNDGRNIIPVTANYGANPSLNLDRILLLGGIQLAQEYHWTVDFQASRRGHSLRLPTSPEGVKQLLKDRGIPSGKQRRTYLKNWVKEHMRNTSADKDLTLVRQHLRGKQVLDCAGFHCEIRAPLAEVRMLLAKYGSRAPKTVLAEHARHLKQEE